MIKMIFNNADEILVGTKHVDEAYIGNKRIFKKYVVHFQNLINDSSASNRGTSGVTFKKVQANEWIVYGTPTAINCFCNLDYVNKETNSEGLIEGHTYLNGSETEDGKAWAGTFNVSGEPNSIFHYAYKTNPVATITKLGTGSYTRLQIRPEESEWNIPMEQITIYPQLYDLTAMFSDAPELMPTTVEEFRKLFPYKRYPYTPEPYDVYFYL